MHASNKGADPDALQGLRADDAMFLRAVWHGAIGRTVRCVPWRRTVMAEGPRGVVVFAKLRRGRLPDARAEWHWLHVLPLLGFRVPVPLAFLQRGRRSLVATAAVAGRPLDALLREAVAAGRIDAVRDFLTDVAAPCVRRLHDAGLVFRDLYWNHLFAQDLTGDVPVLIDVERVLQPRWRMQRWIVKDLAGLLASTPVPLPCRLWLRALHAYQRGRPPGWKDLAAAVRRKAARIAAHRPRYG